MDGSAPTERWIEVGPEIWIVEGPAVSFFGLPCPTRVTLVRLANRQLWVCSPIRLDAELREQIHRLGEVASLVSPNKLHHLFLGDWQAAWPDARLYASPGLARRRPDLTFDAELTDVAPPEWADQLDQLIVRGSWAIDEVLFFHRASRTLIVTDFIQSHDPDRMSRLQRWFLRLNQMDDPRGTTPRDLRLSFLNRRAARNSIRRALAWNPERLIVAHGPWTPTDARAHLQHATRWLGN